MQPPCVIEDGRLVVGPHPCAWGIEHAQAEVDGLLGLGVTLFLDLTHDGELEPYVEHLRDDVRHLRLPIRDLGVPRPEALVATLDEIDKELAAGGVVYVHCWAGCGRTGVVLGCWLVRHGLDPHDALARIAETRGRGCPQTLEQRLTILSWERGR